MSAPRELPGFYFDPQKNKYFPLINGKPPPHLRNIRPPSPPPRPRSPDRPPSPIPIRTLPPSARLDRLLRQSGQLPQHAQATARSRRILRSLTVHRDALVDLVQFSGEKGKLMDAWACEDTLVVATAMAYGECAVDTLRLDRTGDHGHQRFLTQSDEPSTITALSFFSNKGHLAFTYETAPQLENDTVSEKKTTTLQVFWKESNHTLSGRFAWGSQSFRLPKDSSFGDSIAAHPTLPLFLFLGRENARDPKAAIYYGYDSFHELAVSELLGISQKSNLSVGKFKYRSIQDDLASSPPTNIRFSDDGNLIVTVHTAYLAIYRYDIKGVSLRATMIHSFSFSRELIRDPFVNLASYSRTMFPGSDSEYHKLLFDTPKGAKLLSFQFNGPRPKAQRYNDRQMELTDIRKAQNKTGSTMRKLPLAVSPDGSGMIVVGSEDGEFSLFAGYNEKVDVPAIHKELNSRGKGVFTRVAWAKGKRGPLLVFSGDKQLPNNEGEQLFMAFSPPARQFKKTFIEKDEAD